jgi:tripartite ATP-independent transporter DctM subunit
MSVELQVGLLFLSLLVLLASGVPIAFSIGSIGMLFTLILWGPAALYNIASVTFGTMGNFVLIAVPLFIFMGNILQVSGIADSLYEMMYKWMGPVRGGLAMGTVIICAIFAAMAGISGAATVTMGIISLPSMLKRNYDKSMALGCISAGGALGILIPPSLMMIIYGSLTALPVGQLFMGGVLPGILLAILFILYIGIRSAIQKDLAPGVPVEERSSLKEKLVSTKALILPILIIISVLGALYKGIVTPTEAAGVGVVGSLVAGIINRKLTWAKLKEAALNSFSLTSMVLWIVIGSTCFSTIYTAIGGASVIEKMLSVLPLGCYGILFVTQFSILILGMFLDPVALMIVGTPVFLPLITKLGFNPLWFGIIFTMNLEMAYLTPPIGFNLFFLKGIVPPGITMGDIYRSVTPFVILQMIGLAIVVIFPELALWLPMQMK